MTDKIIAEFKNHEDGIVITLTQTSETTARCVRRQVFPDGSEVCMNVVEGGLISVTVEFSKLCADEALLAGGVDPL